MSVTAPSGQGIRGEKVQRAMRKGRRKQSWNNSDFMFMLVQLATIVSVVYGAGPGHK